MKSYVKSKKNPDGNFPSRSELVRCALQLWVEKYIAGLEKDEILCEEEGLNPNFTYFTTYRGETYSVPKIKMVEKGENYEIIEIPNGDGTFQQLKIKPIPKNEIDNNG